MRMNQCDNYSMAVQLYLDNELMGSAQEFFLTHVDECAHCREQLESEQRLSELLRRTHPLYSASEELRARVESVVTHHSAVAGDRRFELRKRVVSFLSRPVKYVRQPTINLRVVAAGFAAIALVFAFVPFMLQRVRAADYVETAVSTHRNYLEGKLPLEFNSDSPEKIAAWFADKVPFHFQLPASQLAPNVDSAFRLSGGRIVSFRGGYAALVAYHSQREEISLLVASSKSAAAADGDALRSNGLTFYFTSKGGFNVVTWTNHGLTYALVSSLHGSAQHSCLVCHQNFANRSEFR
jgi:anti-sigma factor (TIGR02949 family)